jgi:hypothetical protein
MLARVHNKYIIAEVGRPTTGETRTVRLMHLILAMLGFHRLVLHTFPRSIEGQ